MPDHSLSILLEGPLESDYSLAIVNRCLANALIERGEEVQLHQRDNITYYQPSERFQLQYPSLADRLIPALRDAGRPNIHSRYIYPPFTDNMIGEVNTIHCYGWEESRFPRHYADYFNKRLDVVTTMSHYVSEVLRQSGVSIPTAVVGLGADHILSVTAEPVEWFSRDKFSFLHVSSCFPRKGCDVLVEAFCREFSSKDDVRLVIKTFPNPHNTIHDIIRDATRRHPKHAPIKVTEAPLNAGEIRFLYEASGCVVSPSRGEGFGLPVAEAMLLGVPVVATIHGGQADICSAENCWPVEFNLSPARTHMGLAGSLWAEPVVESIQTQMRGVFAASPKERLLRTDAARRHVSANFTWGAVAERHLLACQESQQGKPVAAAHATATSSGDADIRIGFISSWNSRCGIAEYVRYLASSMGDGFSYQVFASHASDLVGPDTDNVVRCWTPHGDDPQEMEMLAHYVIESGVQVVSIQFNFAFFQPAMFARLVDRLKDSGIPILITLHSTKSGPLEAIADALRGVDQCIVHRQEDLELLQRHGIQNGVIQMQGIPVGRRVTAARNEGDRQKKPFVLGCFGFLLPPKGIYELIQAFSLVYPFKPWLRLQLFNSLYPHPVSPSYAEMCVNAIRDTGLSDAVDLWTQFLSEEEILEALAAVDLVVLPYTHSEESSSAAVRLPLASLTPVLCSNLPLFDEVGHVVHRFAANNVFALAEEINRLASAPALLFKHREAQARFAAEHSWPNVAAHFTRVVRSHLQKRPARGVGA